ncbi:hypothetical protein [Natrialba magadii]|uniref:hypothetical protein n=1 Tax=Natrialba magadii TaxID=13769 RepID=UPI0001973F57|nr:hypothetical protein [Natrialba magadii]
MSDTGDTAGDAADDQPSHSPSPSSPPPLPDCPICGQSVTTVTIHGPTTATAAPCGCRAPPEVLLVDAESVSSAPYGRDHRRRQHRRCRWD